MALKRLWGLEVWLLIAMAVYLMFSANRNVEHAPHWGLWVAAGLLAVFTVARPKIIGIKLLSGVAIWALLVHGVALFEFGPLVFATRLAEELQQWFQDPYSAGLLLAWTFTSLGVFLLVYFQFLMISKGRNIAPTIILGLAVYTLMWYYRFPDAEQGLFVFLTLAFPTASFLYIRNQSSLDRRWYKAGILALAVVSALLVSIMPRDIDRLDVPEILRVFTDPYAGESHDPDGEDIGLARDVRDRRTGYAPGSELGGGLTESHERVITIELLEGTLPSSLYLRGRAMDYYTGHSWEKRAAEPAADLDSAFEHVQVYDSDLKMRVYYLEPERDLFALFPTTAIEIEKDAAGNPEEGLYAVDSFGNIDALDLEFAGQYSLSGKAITSIDLEDLEKQTELEKGAGELLPFLQVPDDLPERIEELALDITSEAGSKAEKADLIEKYLRRISYTRNTPEPPQGVDFVDHFLFDLQEGYCSYYATAMVILLRLNEVPARYVEGYRASFYTEEELTWFHPEDPATRQMPRSMEVRKSNAHAWVEAFLPGYGWVVFEPTGPYRVPAGGSEVETEEADREEEDAAAVAALDDETKGRLISFYVGLVLFAGLAAGILTFSFLKLSRAKHPGDLYTRVVKVRAAFKHLPEPGETPGRITAQLKEEIPGLAEEFEAMTVLYQNLCYSGKKGEPKILEPGLAALPLKTALLYRYDFSPSEYALGWFRLLFSITIRRRLIVEDEPL